MIAQIWMATTGRKSGFIANHQPVYIFNSSLSFRQVGNDSFEHLNHLMHSFAVATVENALGVLASLHQAALSEPTQIC
jgi:hypothetical protein